MTTATFPPGTSVRVSQDFDLYIPTGLTRDDFLARTYVVQECSGNDRFVCLAVEEGAPHRQSDGSLHDGWYVAPSFLTPVETAPETAPEAPPTVTPEVQELRARVEFLTKDAQQWRDRALFAGQWQDRAINAEQAADRFRKQVREVAIRVAEEQNWCDQGLNEVLDELGLDRKEIEYNVTVNVTLHASVTIPITAPSVHDARDLANESADEVETALRNEYGVNRVGAFDDVEWEADEVEEA